MKANQPIWEFSEIANVPFSHAKSIIFNIEEGAFDSEHLPFILKRKEKCEIIKTENTFLIKFPHHQENVIIDNQKNKFIIQGEWWYRGIYELKMDTETTTRITLEVHNIAKKYRWVAGIMVLPEKSKHQANFENFVKMLENEYLLQIK